MKIDDLKFKIGPFKVTIGKKRIREVLLRAASSEELWDRAYAVLTLQFGIRPDTAERIVERLKAAFVEELEAV